MNEVSQYRVYLLFAVLTICVVVPMSVFVRLRTTRTPLAPLFWFLVAGLWVIVANMMELLSASPRVAIGWSFVGYAGLVIIPPLWFFFANGYTGRSPSPHFPRFLPFVVPLLTLVFLYTNPHGGLHWTFVSVDKVGPFSVLSIGRGPWFWVYVVHQYGLLLYGIAIIGIDFFASRRFYSLQALCAVFGAIFPLCFNVLYIFHLMPGVRKDFTPVSFAFAGIAFTIGIRKYRLFDVVPVAYRQAFDAVSDAIFVVDSGDRLVEANSAAFALFGLSPKLFGSGLSSFPPLLSVVRDADASTDRKAELVLGGVDGERRYEATVRALGTGPGSRRLYALRDVSDRHEMYLEKCALVDSLSAALSELHTLRGIIPICAKCKKIRDDDGYWQQVETYLMAHGDVHFTHGLCPDCAGELYAQLNGIEGGANLKAD